MGEHFTALVNKPVLQKLNDSLGGTDTVLILIKMCKIAK